MMENLKPPKPSNETERLKALRSFNILDSDEEEFYDNIAKLASFICDTEIALVTFIDDERQWFKAKVGLDIKGTSRDEAFCAYAIHQSDIMIVSDPTTDERFFQNPLVISDPNIRFYAGAPLVTSDGYGLGTLCVIDSKQKELTTDQLNALDQLRRIAVQYLEFRKINTFKEKMNVQVQSLKDRVSMMLKEIELKNAELQELSKVLSHDLRAPLRGISSLAEWMLEDHKDNLPDEIVEQLGLIKDRTLTLNGLLDAVIEYSKLSRVVIDNKPIDLEPLIQELVIQCKVPVQFKVDLTGNFPTLRMDKISLHQIFQNLIQNAVTYSDKDNPVINIHSELVGDFWEIKVMDNGIGIMDKNLDKIFDLFVSMPIKDGIQSSGIGLSLVKRTVTIYGGTVEVNSEIGVGSEFIIRLPKSLEAN